ncbi:MAG: thymidine phosphorylase [Nitrospirae bacterium]|nr:thymidine phosphorylase [Nitrospirota bacterium]
MRVYDIILKKRNGNRLTKEEIAFVVDGYTKGEIPDYQISALLMAIYFQGMDDEETSDLTEAMMKSGEVYDLTSIPGKKIDKHSTGGVGDKTSIILAPLMASAGLVVPMMSGRGLGHTGGTLDKLESISGFRINLTKEEVISNLKKINAAMTGQSEFIAPADKKMYSLRDITGTVESIPLIAASIMSKKLAEGIEGLVLDVKVGTGAFMKDIDDARRLARAMVDIGNLKGVKTVAIITAMDQPLGKTIGNSLEIKECISALRGKWPEDLKKVTLTLGAWMLRIADEISGQKAEDIQKYKERLEVLINNGSAFNRFVEMIDAQYGDPETAFKPSLLPSAKKMKQIIIQKEGYIQRMDAEKIGIASMMLGAGRQRIEDTIDHSAGIILNKKAGDYIKAGEQIAMFYYNDDKRLKEAEEIFLSGIEIGTEKVKTKDLILEVIE